MAIKLHNSATRMKETFQPLREGEVGMYVCGVTVYDLCHIGHARSAIFFDVLVRYLKARGFKVTYVRNFTDIDDKIIKRAQEMGKDTADLAREYIHAFYEDMGKMAVLNADIEPCATEHIDGMIEMISTLLDKDFAYVSEGDVYYSVERFEGYGRLSGPGQVQVVRPAHRARPDVLCLPDAQKKIHVDAPADHEAAQGDGGRSHQR